MASRAFAADEEPEDEGGTDPAPDEAAAPEYTFEGFTVEFSDLVMLTPVAPR